MEFLRFGSNIPGGYWGCCACCIIQDFKQMPDQKASIQLVDGDGGAALTGGSKGGSLYAGPTFEDIFETRIRIGTFSQREMPNHAFFAILTRNQLNGAIGKAWLPILKRHGFEFLRTVCNSVYAGASIIDKLPTSGGQSENYIFALFRNIGGGAIANPFKAPKEWLDLAGTPEVNEFMTEGEQRQLAEGQFDFQKKSWQKGKTTFVYEEDLIAAGAPIIAAGKRGGALPHDITSEAKKRVAAKTEAKVATPFGKA